MRRSCFLTACAVALIAVHGLVHGWWSGRWSEPHDPGAAARRLAALPMNLGDWKGESMSLDAKHQALGEIQGYVLRRYAHRRSRAVVSMLLVWGRGGPIAAHSPDVCYRGAGFEIDGTPRRHPVDWRSGGAVDEFWTAPFRKPEEEAAPLRLFWGWNDRRGWQAPSHPRFAFGGAPILYKLYVVREISAAEGSAADDPAAEFLRLLLPALDSVIREE